MLKLETPRAVWVMLPAGEITEATIDELAKLHAARRFIIDGGNTFWQDDVRRGKALKERASTISTSAPPAASGASSAAIA